MIGMLKSLRETYGGRIYHKMIPIDNLLPTRHCVHKNRYEEYKDPDKIKDILVIKDKGSNNFYILDGHHRTKATKDIGGKVMSAQTLDPKIPGLIEKAAYWNNKKKVSDLVVVEVR